MFFNKLTYFKIVIKIILYKNNNGGDKMALKLTNINELKSYKTKIEKSKLEYDETIKHLMDTIKLSAIYWQGEEGNLFRDNLYSLVGVDLNVISNEMKAEIDYLNRLITILENAQEQIKSRING